MELNVQLSALEIKPIVNLLPSNPMLPILVLDEFAEDASGMLCPVCNNLVNDAVHCGNCTNLLCKNCVVELKENKGGKCPHCNEALVTNNLVLMVKNLLRKFKLRCFFSQPREGCNETDLCDKTLSYFDYEDHVKKCDYFPYKCPYQECKFSAPKLMLPKHMINCPLSTKECPNCKKQVQNSKMTEHMNVCEALATRCPRCSKVLNPNTKDAHMKNALECFKYLTVKHQMELQKKENDLSNAKGRLSGLKEDVAKIEHYKNDFIQAEHKYNLLSSKLSQLNMGGEDRVKELQNEIAKIKNNVNNMKEKKVALSNKLVALQKEHSDLSNAVSAETLKKTKLTNSRLCLLSGVVSKYNNDYVCRVHGYEIVDNQFKVYIDVNTTGSLGELQNPIKSSLSNTSKNCTYKPIDGKFETMNPMSRYKGYLVYDFSLFRPGNYYFTYGVSGYSSVMIYSC